MTFQSNNSIGYYLWLYLIKLIKLKQYLKKKHLSKSFIYEKNIPNDYKSIYVEVEYTFLSKLNSYFTNIFLYWYNNFNNHITNHIIAVENFNDDWNCSESRGNSPIGKDETNLAPIFPQRQIILSQIPSFNRSISPLLPHSSASLNPLEQKILSLDNLDDPSTLRVDVMNSLLRISEVSNRKFEESKEFITFTGQWFERGCIPPYYYPIMSVIGHDLLVTFPDSQTIVDIFFTEVIGMSLASNEESKCYGARFHEGFLQNLTHKTGKDKLYLSQIKDYIRDNQRINRIIISGTGKGAAAAAIFTLRHYVEMTSWSIPSSSSSSFSSSSLSSPSSSSFEPTKSIHKSNIHEEEFRENSILFYEQNKNLHSQQNSQQERKLDVKCITFSCPAFIQKSDIHLIPPSISSCIVHIYGEHETIPLSLTSLTNIYERVGLLVYIKDSKSSNLSPVQRLTTK